VAEGCDGPPSLAFGVGAGLPSTYSAAFSRQCIALAVASQTLVRSSPAYLRLDDPPGLSPITTVCRLATVEEA
jgi:hypothetical protein